MENLTTMMTTLKLWIPQGHWIGLFVIIFVAFTLGKITRSYGRRFLKKNLSKHKIKFDEKKQIHLVRPLGLTVIAGSLLILLPLLRYDANIMSWLLRFARVLLNLALTLVCYNFVDLICLYLAKKARESDNKFDDILVPLLRKSAKFFVIVVGIISVGNALTLDMKGLIAGLGIGGLALALAAKDTISNLFGSLTVILDHPFRIGDWVVVNDKIEGTVEEVGLRSCRIRTFYDSLITIPNGELTNAHIDNYGARDYRRLSTKIAIEYGTPPEKIEAFCEGIRQLILGHPYTRKEKYQVWLSNMGDSALEVMLYVFWKVPTWSQELQERHRLLMDILRLGKELEIQFAFPTHTIHTIPGQPPHYSPLSLDQAHPYGTESAEKIIQQQKTTSGII